MDLDQGESIRYFQDIMASCSGNDHPQLKKISMLDKDCENVCHDFEKMAIQLVDSAESDKKTEPSEQTIMVDNNNVELSCMKNINLVKGAWAHILRLDDCSKLHHRNAANYQEFFFEIGEYEKSMDQSLPKIFSEVESLREGKSIEDGEKLLKECKDLTFALQFFQDKATDISQRSKKIVPVYKRTDGNADGIPVTALSAFKDKQIEIKQGEDLSLLGNKDIKLWKVKNGRGQTGDVPSPIILIPPPDSRAIEAAFKLQEKLLGHWATALKVLGKSILPYMDKTLGDWMKQKPDILKELPPGRKVEIKNTLDKAKKTFVRIWEKYPAFNMMNKDGEAVSKMMDSGKGKGPDDPKVKQASEIMEGSVTAYKNLLDQFARYAMLVQMAKLPEQLLMVEGWEDYKLQSLDDLIGHWQTYVLDPEEPPEEVRVEEEEVTTSESSQRMKYVFSGAPDPWGGEDLDYETATKKGIIDVKKGVYNNPKTGETKPLGQAAAEGLVFVEVQYL